MIFKLNLMHKSTFISTVFFLCFTAYAATAQTYLSGASANEAISSEYITQKTQFISTMENSGYTTAETFLQESADAATTYLYLTSLNDIQSESYINDSLAPEMVSDALIRFVSAISQVPSVDIENGNFGSDQIRDLYFKLQDVITTD